jgi:hypothetical protein
MHMTLKLQELDTIVAANFKRDNTATSQEGTDAVRKTIRAANVQWHSYEA